jgi:ABC-type lipoprotein release transport system permease subunit
VLELRLAWRNVWRNPRRTVLTVAATVFAVVLVVFFVAMAAGVHEKMIEDAVRVRSGHVSLSGEGYLERQTLEQFVRFDSEVERLLDETRGVEGYAPRLIGFGLLSKGSSTRGAAVLGVDPEREPSVSTLAERVRAGSFVTRDGKREMVLGERLAKVLSAEIGDEVLLYSVAYSLETAYDLFRVVGIMKLPEPGLDRSLAVIPLAAAQEFFVYGDRVSEVAILAAGADWAVEVERALSQALSSGPLAQAQSVEVHTWSERMPELVQIIFLDDAGMYILLVILVIVVGFGIFNTILMAVLERKREFGVLLALGLGPSTVFRIVYLESLLLAAVGLAIGLAAALPLVLYFQAHPIELTGEAAGAMELFGFEPLMTWKLKPLNPIGSAITILGVAIAAALYPAVKASRGRPVDVLRSL